MTRAGSLALCAMGAVLCAAPGAAASAAQFTYSETGKLVGDQTSNQIFTPAAGGPSVVCQTAHTAGAIEATAAETQAVTVEYSMCTIPALFGAAVDSFTATYELRADGTVAIPDAIVLSVTAEGCSTTVTAGQTVGSVGYTNVNGNTELTAKAEVSGIHSTSTGLCPGGTNGSLVGNSVIKRSGGGFVRLDP